MFAVRVVFDWRSISTFAERAAAKDMAGIRAQGQDKRCDVVVAQTEAAGCRAQPSARGKNTANDRHAFATVRRRQRRVAGDRLEQHHVGAILGGRQ